MTWAVEEALTLRAYAVVAAGAISRFEPVATTIGARSWVALAALVDAAVLCGRLDTALRLLDAAEAAAVTTGSDTSTTNAAGRHRERIRGRRAELAGQETPTEIAQLGIHHACVNETPCCESPDHIPIRAWPDGLPESPGESEEQGSQEEQARQASDPTGTYRSRLDTGPDLLVASR